MPHQQSNLPYRERGGPAMIVQVAQAYGHITPPDDGDIEGVYGRCLVEIKDELVNVQDRLNTTDHGVAQLAVSTRSPRDSQDEMRSQYSRFDAIDETLGSHSSQFEAVDETLKSHSSRFDAVDETLRSHSSRFDSIDETLRIMQLQFSRFDETLREMREGLSIQFTRIDFRFANIESSVVDIKNSVVDIEASVDNIETSVENIEGRMASMEDRMEDIEGRVGNIEDRVVKIEDRVVNIEDKLAEQEDKSFERAGSVNAEIEDIEARLDTRINDVEKVQEEARLELKMDMAECFRSWRDDLNKTYEARWNNSHIRRLHERVWPVGVWYTDAKGTEAVRMPEGPHRKAGYYWNMHSPRHCGKLIDLHKFYKIDYRDWAWRDTEGGDDDEYSYEDSDGDSDDRKPYSLQEAVYQSPPRAVKALFRVLGLAYYDLREQFLRYQQRQKERRGADKRSLDQSSSPSGRLITKKRNLSQGSTTEAITESTQSTQSAS